ncbi:dual specificity phosphatase 29-like [Carassius gibelio]|uniref:dual specificity phosphatase 29-like n=1 Tax=Carassius gibelio TaxID=101364 RepID=UPI002279B308|nr:dual specificity phosphatase 29-like [Carassius gibelio]
MTEPAGSSSGNDQGGMDTSPTTTEKTSPTENTKVRKTNKICAFFRRRWKAVKKIFQKNRVAPIGSSAQPDPETVCVPGPSDPKPELQMDLVEAEQLCVPDLVCLKTEQQVETELSILQMYIPQSAIQLQDRLEQCTLDWTPITEVWCNVFIGNEETAKDRAKLKEMGITHILNATASEEDLYGKISSREEYYQGMNITYYNVPAVDEVWFNISEYFFPAAEFIHKALSNPENKVLVHCIHGVSRSATLVLGYLMIHHGMMVEHAIDHATNVRWIGPNVGFLNQLTVLNSDLVEQQKLQLRKQLDKSKETRF